MHDNLEREQMMSSRQTWLQQLQQHHSTSIPGYSRNNMTGAASINFNNTSNGIQNHRMYNGNDYNMSTHQMSNNDANHVGRAYNDHFMQNFSNQENGSQQYYKRQ